MDGYLNNYQYKYVTQRTKTLNMWLIELQTLN